MYHAGLLDYVTLAGHGQYPLQWFSVLSQQAEKKFFLLVPVAGAFEDVLF